MADKKKSTELEKEAIRNYFIQFLNLEKQFPLLPGTRDEANVAAFIGLEKEELIQAREAFSKVAKTAAEELLKDEEIALSLEKLPFKKGELIMVIGDSLTDDLQGWFEILRHVLHTALPDYKLKFRNLAVSNDTTHNMLKRFNRDVLAEKPDWLIIAAGTFDAQRLHVATDRTHTSLADFWENLNSMENAVKTVTKNPVIWITPPPVITELMEKVPFFDGIVDEEDLSAYRDVISGKAGYIIDPVGERMGRPGDAWNYLPDGMHPSPAGHVQTVKYFLKALTSQKEPKKGATLNRDE
ncbi:MAG: GDSL-type esterase/lipase family protein [Rhodothermaceae bacterium]|nr:GDSL-type esterase/lipase family protein [Rhodothermaceae bacterium]